MESSKTFLWDYLTFKIKHSTLSNERGNGGLKSVNNFSKVISLQCLWIFAISKLFKDFALFYRKMLNFWGANLFFYF